MIAGGVASEALYRTLVEAAPDALIVLDHRGTIRLVNAQTETLLGYHRDELIGRSLDLLVPEKYRTRHVEHVAAFFAAPRPRAIGAGLELYACRKDGTEIAVEISLSPIELDGERLVSSSIRDMTERHGLERSLARASRMKSEFLANMSHELRTPLNAIIGFADLMAKGKAGPLAPDQAEYLGDILTSARHLLQLINDVLDLSKIEAGKLELRFVEVDLAQLVREVRDVVRGLANAKRLQLDLEVVPTVARVVVDAARLKRVLYNFLANAIKFTDEGGRVDVRVGPDDDAAMFRIDVTDTGIGIAEADLPRLFVEFQQLESGAGKRYQGTGLGLALSKQLVEEHGGRVEVASRLGHGSTFSAILPRAPRGAQGG